MKFSFGLFIGALVPAFAIYLAGESRASCLAFGFLLSVCAAILWPRRILRYLLWIAGECSSTPAAKPIPVAPKTKLTDLERDVIDALIRMGMRKSQAERNVKAARGAASDFTGLFKAALADRRAA